MKKQILATFTVAVFGLSAPVAPNAVAQDFPEGPIGEIISSVASGDFGSTGLSTGLPSADLAASPNIVRTPNGEAVELFNPAIPFGEAAAPVADVVSAPLQANGTKTDWITPDGRINLQNASPEAQLWAPNNPSGGEWTDGTLGLQVGIDWLLFSRGINGGVPFATNDLGNSFSTADFDFETESTARYRIGFASEFGTGVEFVTYDFDEFNSTLSLTGDGIQPVFFGGVPEEADAFTATYRSRIKSFEFNVWGRQSERLRIGYGLRHFGIEERYDITVGADASTADPMADVTGLFSKTDNNLFGGQLMLEVSRRISSQSLLEAGVKGMVLNNRADIDLDTENVDLSGDDSFVTGGVNFNAGINYRPFRGFNFRAGYEGIFIGSVATGISQSENNDVFESDLSPAGEGLYFGGGYAGCTLTF